MKGVNHYKKDGTVHKGGTHKMPDGSLHSGKSEGKKSEKAFKEGERWDKDKMKERKEGRERNHRSR